MTSRPQADTDAEAFEAKQLAEMEEKGGVVADLVAAIRMARQGRTEADLDCTYTETGEAKFTIQQGLKAAAYAREDVAAVLILQVKVLKRLDRLQKFVWCILGILVTIALKLFG